MPQGVKKWKDCLIHYRLGNFLFDTDGYPFNTCPEVIRSHIFHVTIEDGKIVDWHRRYLRLNRDEGGHPHPISEDQYDKEDAYYKGLDARLQDPDQLREV